MFAIMESLLGVSVNPGMFFWGIGIIVAQIYYQIFGKKYGYKWYQSLLLGLLFLTFEMIGAKILYIVENMDYVIKNGIRFSGFSFFGIMFSVPILVFLFSKCIKNKCGQLLDFASVGILFELSCYRIGCFFEGCCGGILIGNVQVPVQLIEAVLDVIMGVLLIVLYAKNKLKTGEQYLLYMSGYGVIRFILEFMRLRNVIFLGMSLSHIWALIAAITGITVLVLKRKKSILESDICNTDSNSLLDNIE